MQNFLSVRSEIENVSNQNKLLSICILSYNQVEEIERLLISLQNQYTNDLEILMRDDSTNDETKELVEKYSIKIPITYYKGVKEGIDNTVIFLTRKAVGKFIWWMGDDTIEPEGVAEVLNVIKTYPNVNFIWANCQIYNTNILAINIKSGSGPIDKNELLKLGGAGLGFISATIFEREMGLKALPRAEKYIGSLFTNLYIVMYVISKSYGCYYLRGPIVMNYPTTSEEIKKLVIKSDGKIENRGFEVYGITLPDIIREFSKDFMLDVIDKVIKTSFRSAWQGMYVGWIGGWDTPQGKKMKLFKNYWQYPSAYLAIVLLSLPVSINKKLYIVFKYIKTYKFRRHMQNRY